MFTCPPPCPCSEGRTLWRCVARLTPLQPQASSRPHAGRQAHAANHPPCSSPLTFTCPFPSPPLLQVACGAHTTLALTDGGHVYNWGAHAVTPSPPTRMRLGGSPACTLAAGSGHCAIVIGEYPLVSTSEADLSRAVGFQQTASRAVIPASVGSELGSISAIVEAGVPLDADPATVLQELHELRGVLAHEEARRDATSAELMDLQQQLQQVLVDEEMLRERRGGVEPAEQPNLSKGVAFVDADTYKSMLLDEQVELSLFGFKVALAKSKRA